MRLKCRYHYCRGSFSYFYHNMQSLDMTIHTAFLCFQLESDEILNIDAILENALHVCVLQPLKQDIYRLFVNEYTK